MKEDSGQPKKQLPRRQSRGVRSQQTEQQKHQDDQLYRDLFGDVDMSQSDQEEEDSSFEGIFHYDSLEQIAPRSMDSFTANFAKYNYSRGYHYFFNLDTFPRVQGAPSYALDDTNRFNSTYSQDQLEINGTKLKKLLNRHYIGLPSIETTMGKSKNKDKNVCHYHLFNNEDKKYYNHRQMAKYKYVLQNLHFLTKSGKLNQYTELKKDPILFEVCQPGIPIQRKQQILENKIKTLEERVLNTSAHWEWEDQVHFHFSLDQIFHNQAQSKGQQLSVKHLEENIFSRIISRRRFITSTEEGSVTLGALKPKTVIENWLNFQLEGSRNCLSENLQNRLRNSMKLIEMFSRKEELITFPLYLFDLGDAQRAVDILIRENIQEEQDQEEEQGQNLDQGQNEDEVVEVLRGSPFSVYKSFIKKLFKRDLLKSNEPLNSESVQEYEDYTTKMKKKIAQIQQFYEEESKTEQKKYNLDSIVDIEKIQSSPIEDHVILLPSENKVEITIKDLMLLFFYRNISQALTEFMDYINQDPEILTLMADQNYQKYHYGIAKILYQHQFTILLNDIERFTEILNDFDIAPEFNQTLYFNFNKNLRVGYVWTDGVIYDWEGEGEGEEDIQEVDEEDEDEGERKPDEQDEAPVKKVKTD